jgi:TonB family protein
MNVLVESAIKVSLLVSVALVATALLRSRSAALRHWILAATVAAALATPALIVFGPAWNLPVRPSVGAVPQTAARASATGADDVITTSSVHVDVSRPAAPFSGVSLFSVVVPSIWIAGAAFQTCGLAFGLWRLSRMASLAQVVHDGPWVAVMRKVQAEYGLYRPVTLLQSDRPALLVTWGLVRPQIMLPVDAHTWSEDRIHVVLAHELAHVQRGDWAVQMAGELLRIVYWFNPLIWLACARLRQESEGACDDAVVNLGVQGREYATHLLELARRFGRSQPSFPAVAMASRPSSLERRVSAMLNTGLSRRPPSFIVRIASVSALLAVALPIALFAQNRFSTLSGSIMDPSGGLLPGVTVTAIDTNRGARHEVKTNRTGQFEIIGLAEGPHVLAASLPGFQTYEQKLTLDGQDVNRNITMRVGTLQETVSVTRGSAPPSFEGQRFTPKPADCGASGGRGGAGAAPVRIGGQIRQPKKVRHVSPIYPEGSSPGVVRLETVINPNGFVQDTKVLNSAPPALAQAAVDAVAQWEFTPTLLNCVAVPVSMTVTVDFN